MAKFRKKPVEIEAVRWTGDNIDEVMLFCAGNATYELMSKGNAELVISTLEDGTECEAVHVASRGDWIIKGVKGEFYPCKPDIFDETYDAIIEGGNNEADMSFEEQCRFTLSALSAYGLISPP